MYLKNYKIVAHLSIQVSGCLRLRIVHDFFVQLSLRALHSEIIHYLYQFILFHCHHIITLLKICYAAEVSGGKWKMEVPDSNQCAERPSYPSGVHQPVVTITLTQCFISEQKTMPHSSYCNIFGLTWILFCFNLSSTRMCKPRIVLQLWADNNLHVTHFYLILLGHIQ